MDRVHRVVGGNRQKHHAAMDGIPGDLAQAEAFG
jgi:hypothetical protein